MSKRPTKKKAKSASTRSKVRALMPKSGKAAAIAKADVQRKIMLVSLLAGANKQGVKLVTDIPALSGMKLTREQLAWLTAIEAVDEAHGSSEFHLPASIELAARYIAQLIERSYAAQIEGKEGSADVLADTLIDLAVQRAKELWAGGSRQ